MYFHSIGGGRDKRESLFIIPGVKKKKMLASGSKPCPPLSRTRRKAVVTSTWLCLGLQGQVGEVGAGGVTAASNTNAIKSSLKLNQSDRHTGLRVGVWLGEERGAGGGRLEEVRLWVCVSGR